METAANIENLRMEINAKVDGARLETKSDVERVRSDMSRMIIQVAILQVAVVGVFVSAGVAFLKLTG